MTNYTAPKVDSRWSDTRETHPAVAMAIHAIADDKRSPEAIWDAPTPAEFDHVCMAVEEYVNRGLFDRETIYQWGQEVVTI